MNKNSDNNIDKTKEVYKSAIGHLEIREDFEEDTIHLIKKANQKKMNAAGIIGRTGRKLLQRPIYRQKRFYFAAAACVAAVILILPIAFNLTRPELKLGPSSKGVKVSYVNTAPGVHASYDLVQLTEDQIFNEHSDAAFRGTVNHIQNIEISFGIASKEYRAIATIMVDKVYRGDMNPGDLVQILLPCPIDTGLWVEDTEVASVIRVGMEGIFLPMKYDDTSIYSEGGGTLYLKDICAYGFADGARFAFLKTDQGIIYADWSFNIDPKPATLDDVEKYILTKLK